MAPLKFESKSTYLAPSVDPHTKRPYLGSSEVVDIISGRVDRRRTPALHFGDWAHGLIERRLRGQRWAIKRGTQKDAGLTDGVCTLTPSDASKMAVIMANVTPLIKLYRGITPSDLRIESSIYVPLDRVKAHVGGKWYQMIKKLALDFGRSPKASADLLIKNGENKQGWATYEWLDWKTTTYVTTKQMKAELNNKGYLLRGAWQAMAYTAGGMPITKLSWVFLAKTKMKPVKMSIELNSKAMVETLRQRIPSTKGLKEMINETIPTNGVVEINL